MNKLLCMLSATAICLSMSIPQPTNAMELNTISNETINFTTATTKGLIIQDGTVTGYNGTSTSVTIPSSVSKIGQRAFYDKAITSVKIPSSVKVIDSNAFYNCEYLSSVELNEGLETIGIDAFENCKALTNITIPVSLKSIDTLFGAFAGSGLKTATIKNGRTNIPSALFRDCEKLEKITIPDTVTSIGSDSFKNCKSLKSIDIPNKVLWIGNETFEGCSKLSNVSLSRNLRTIGYGAFQDCKSLKKINIPKSLYSADSIVGVFDGTSLSEVTFEEGTSLIAPNLFLDCTSLKNIKLPSTITRIGDSAFEGCENLTKIDIPDQVWLISNDAFNGCKKLSSVHLPDDLSEIGYGAFKDCKALKKITIPKHITNVASLYQEGIFTGTSLEEVNFVKGTTKIPAYLFKECTSLKHITIPDTVTSIGNGAFSGTGLKEVIIPSKVDYINSTAFSKCINLKKVSITNSVYAIADDAFSESNGVIIHTSKNSYAQEFSIKKGIPYQITMKPIAPSNVKASITGITSIKLNWTGSNDADYYQVYAKKDGQKSYKLVKTVTTSSAKISSLTPRARYSYKVRGYANGTGKKLYSSFSSPISIATNVKTPSNFKASMKSSTSIRLTWKKAAGAKYYQIYRATSKKGKYTKIKTLSSNNTSYVNGGLKTGTIYFYKVRAYNTVKGKNYFSSYSSIKSARPILKQTTTTISKQTSTSAKVTWKGISGAENYQVYRATSKNGKYSCIKTLGSKVRNYTNKSLKKGKTYYYKVRGYKKVGTKKVFSKFSVVKSIKIS